MICHLESDSYHSKNINKSNVIEQTELTFRYKKPHCLIYFEFDWFLLKYFQSLREKMEKMESNNGDTIELNKSVEVVDSESEAILEVIEVVDTIPKEVMKELSQRIQHVQHKYTQIIFWYFYSLNVNYVGRYFLGSSIWIDTLACTSKRLQITFVANVRKHSQILRISKLIWMMFTMEWKLCSRNPRNRSWSQTNVILSLNILIISQLEIILKNFKGLLRWKWLTLALKLKRNVIAILLTMNRRK